MTADDKLTSIASALVLLGLNGDKIFERIRGDLGRGDKRGARIHLNFVDEIIKTLERQKLLEEVGE